MIRTATGDGTTYRRFIDMLAGWSGYVASEANAAKSDDERRVYLRENEAISRVYNRLACLSGTYDDLDRDALNALECEILPLLRDGVAPEKSVPR